MADQWFDSTYMVGKYSPLSPYPSGMTDDDHTWYRARKQFLAYVDHYGDQGYDPKVTVSVIDSRGKDITFYLEKLPNHMGSPTSTISSPTFSSGSQSRSFNSNGLWRIRCETSGDLLIYQVRVDDVQYCSHDCIEPTRGFYITGNSGSNKLVKRYFFVPAGVTPRIMLRTENAGSDAVLKVYKVDSNGTDQPVDIIADDNQATMADGRKVLLCLGNHNRQAPFDGTNEGRRYFQEGVVPHGGSVYPSGSIFAFEIDDPRNLGTQPDGSNIWVRFFKYVPQYFANDPRRLLIPAVHPYYQNVSYGNKSVTCRAFLGFNRGDIGGWANSAELKIQVGTHENSTTSGYSVSTSFTTPSITQPANKQVWNCTSTLKDGTTLKAKGTDTVNKLYIVLNSDYLTWNPNPWSAWPSRLHIIFDDLSGKYASDLGPKNFHAVEISHAGQLGTIDGVTTSDGYRMKAFGALFAGDPNWYTSYWNDSRILFWELDDEPDYAKTLASVYQDYYNRKGNTTKPISLTLQHAQYYREYAQACGLLCR